MDLQMDSSTEPTATAFPVWDFTVSSGIVSFLTGDLADVQAAGMAAFIQLGSIPQLPNLGVPLAEYLTKSVTFGDLDAAIRQSAQNANVPSYVPNYEVVNGRLIVTMRSVKTGSGL